MKAQDLEKRLMDFAIKVLNLVKSINKSEENRIYGKQVIRSSSSIGANYSEALCAISKRDFIHDINKSRKEAKETHYWLMLIQRTNPSFELKITPLIKESEQIVKIFQSSVLTARKNSK